MVILYTEVKVHPSRTFQEAVSRSENLIDRKQFANKTNGSSLISDIYAEQKCPETGLDRLNAQSNLTFGILFTSSGVEY